ncbi:MAG: TIGR01244 family sulfur transferase [Sphingomicrobium sp.]|nr:TIGR01244 family phosphatase [Sphingomonadales bacterium]
MARQLDERMMVAGQINPSALPDYAAQGVTLVINNRPDHEDPDQPTSAEVESACAAAGLAYRHVPIARGMGPSDIDAMRDAIHAAGDGKVLAFCRSGNRSTLVWALARSADGAGREELERCATAAGFSLEPIAHLL